MKRKLPWIVGALSVTFIVAMDAQAQITQRPLPRPKANKCDLKLIAWDWTFSRTIDEEPAAPFDGTNWSIKPKSPAVTGRSKALTIEVQHLVRCHRGNERQPNPSRIETINAQSYRQGISRAGATIIPHPNLRGHVDIYSWVADLSSLPGKIVVQAGHQKTSTLPTWSWDPRKVGRRGQLEVDASYKSDPDEVQESIPGFTGRTVLKGTLRKSAGGQEPTDVKIRVRYNPASETTLAFLVTNEDGMFEKANLGLMTEFFRGSEEYLVPALFHAQETQDLFVAVDLTQWLSFPTSYNFEDRLVITDGVSDALPGFKVSTSPTRFDPGMGFVADDPYSGEVKILGEIDGQVQSEEGPISLWIPAVLAVLLLTAVVILWRWWGRS